jgi:hypothetical protein
MVLAVALLLVHAVEMRIFDMLHTCGLYLLRLRWLLAVAEYPCVATGEEKYASWLDVPPLPPLSVI